MLDYKKSEQVSAQEAIRLANAAGKAKDASEIKEMLALIMTEDKFNTSQALRLMKFRQRKEKYLPPQYNGNKGLLSLFSPYMTCDDLKWMLRFDQLIASNNELYEALFSKEKLSMYNYNLRYEVSVIMIAGSLDWTTPHCTAAEYFYDITSPQKEFITIDNAGHIPFVEKPKEVSMAILKALSNVEKPYC